MENTNSMQDIFGALLPLIVLFVVFYFFLIRPQRMQAKRHKEMLDSLKKGDKVVAQGGFICEITKVEETFFSVKLSDETTARLAREYVAYKLDEDSSNAKLSQEPKQTKPQTRRTKQASKADN